MACARHLKGIVTKIVSIVDVNIEVDYGGIEIAKKRPRTIRRDKYALYDEVMKLKLSNNILTCENVQLRTKVKRLEKESDNKDSKIIGKIKRIEAKIHQSYNQDSSDKNELNKDKSSNIQQVPSLSSSVLTKTSNKFLQQDNLKLEKM